jgi:hypothetical protein
MSTEPRELIVKILNSYTQEMEGYSYFGKNPGISIDDYDEIANEIVKQLEVQALEQKLAVAVEALKFVSMPLTGKNYTIESLIETMNNDQQKALETLAIINADAQKASEP